ncbi:MAG: rhamnulokinase, partial [Clostridia bacterium]|nr:rhamnulokinase [Clostridia bacterium]
MKRVLAFDFGASNGRALIGEITGGKIVYTEVHRFPNDPVSVNGKMYWDFLRLIHEIKTGIVKAKQAGGFDSVGIDTWGVDYGFIDKNGDIVNTPYHYRDLRTEGAMEKVFNIAGGKENVYSRTGIQFMRLNTLFQLYASVTEDKEATERAETMLFIPDLMAYVLTGKKVAEYTVASTSQMISPFTHDWDYELIEKIGFDTAKLPEIVPSGYVYGNIKKEICDELGIDSVPVIAVCTHDTGSAVAAVPGDMENCCYISCGTWSLMGVELDKPVINAESFKENFTNEGGYNKSVRFLKNIMGLWIIQEARRRWQKEGMDYSFAELADMAEQAES